MKAAAVLAVVCLLAALFVARSGVRAEDDVIALGKKVAASEFLSCRQDAECVEVQGPCGELKSVPERNVPTYEAFVRAVSPTIECAELLEPVSRRPVCKDGACGFEY